MCPSATHICLSQSHSPQFYEKIKIDLFKDVQKLRLRVVYKNNSGNKYNKIALTKFQSWKQWEHTNFLKKPLRRNMHQNNTRDFSTLDVVRHISTFLLKVVRVLNTLRHLCFSFPNFLTSIHCIQLHVISQTRGNDAIYNIRVWARSWDITIDFEIVEKVNRSNLNRSR